MLLRLLLACGVRSFAAGQPMRGTLERHLFIYQPVYTEFARLFLCFGWRYCRRYAAKRRRLLP